jgi:alpha-tubulin suppressor-like RCC1 family protein
MGTYFCYNESGYIHGETTSDEFWNFTVDGHAQGTPAYYDGLVYLTSWWGDYTDAGNGYAYCVYASNGTEKWNKTLPISACGSPSLDVSRNTVYISTYHFAGYGKLYALYMNNGTEKWNATVQRTDSTPAIDADGNVYLCGGCEGYSQKQTYCFYPNGTEKWSTSTELDIGDWTCSVAVADGKVFVGKSADVVDLQNMTIACNGTYALNASTGDVIWSYPAGGSSPIVVDGMVFTIGNDGKVYAFGDKTYDFSVGAGTDHFAFEGQVSSRPPNSNGTLSFNISTSEDIQEADSDVDDYTAATNNYYGAQQFNFRVDETSPSKITVIWIGEGIYGRGGTSSDGVYLYVWNGSRYVELDNSDGEDGLKTLTGEITFNVSDYIYSGTVSVMVVQKSSKFNRYSSTIKTDYVKLVVTP